MSFTSDKEKADEALRKALEGCSGCEYDEAEGGLINHCNKCCREIAGAAWTWANSSSRLHVEAH